MDDQRCSVQKKGSRLSLNTGQESPPRVIRKCKRTHVHPGNQSPTWTDVGSVSAAVSESANVSGGQGRRVEETSAASGSLPGLRLHQNSNQAVLSHLMANADSTEPDDDFFDMLVKCQVIETVNFSKGTMKTARLITQSPTVTFFSRAPVWTTNAVLLPLHQHEGPPFQMRTSSASSCALRPSGWTSNG